MADAASPNALFVSACAGLSLPRLSAVTSWHASSQLSARRRSRSPSLAGLPAHNTVRPCSASPGWRSFFPDSSVFCLRAMPQTASTARLLILACYALQFLASGLLLLVLVLRHAAYPLHLRRVAFDRPRPRLQRTGELPPWCRSWVPKEHFVKRCHLGRHHLPDRKHDRAGHRRHSLHASAQRHLASLRGAPIVFLFTMVPMLTFIALIAIAAYTAGHCGQPRHLHEDRARRAALCVGREAAAGFDLSGPLCRSSGRRREPDAHLRQRPSCTAVPADWACCVPRRLWARCSSRSRSSLSHQAPRRAY